MVNSAAAGGSAKHLELIDRIWQEMDNDGDQRDDEKQAARTFFCCCCFLLFIAAIQRLQAVLSILKRIF